MPSRNNRKRHRNAEETMQLLETFVRNGGRKVFGQFVDAVDTRPYGGAVTAISNHEIKDIRKNLRTQLQLHMNNAPGAVEKSEEAFCLIEGSLNGNNKVAAERGKIFRKWSKPELVS